MKRRFIMMIMAVAMTLAATAQTRSLGARLSYGLEFTYQHKLAEGRVLTGDLGFPGFCIDGFCLEAVVTHDWLNPFGAKIPWTTKEGTWNWYLGVGGGIQAADGAFGIGATGRVGIEYNFSIPLQLSVDWRPTIGPMFSSSATTFNHNALYNHNAFALNIRYMFTL